MKMIITRIMPVELRKSTIKNSITYVLQVSVPEERTVGSYATHASVLGEGAGRVTGGYHVGHQLLFRCVCVCVCV